MGFNSGFKGLNTTQHVSGIVMPARPRITALLPPRSYGKPEAAAAAAVDRLLMMGIRMPETF